MLFNSNMKLEINNIMSNLFKDLIKILVSRVPTLAQIPNGQVSTFLLACNHTRGDSYWWRRRM